MSGTPAPDFPNGPQSLGFLKIIPGLIRNPMRQLVRLSRRYGDLVLYRFGGRALYAINHPKHVSHLLETNHQNYTRAPALEDLLPLIGNGLFSSDGEFWVSQRHRTVPAFRQKYDCHIYAVVKQEVDDLVMRWDGLWEEGDRTINVQAEMKELMLSILIKTMFSADASMNVQLIIETLDEILQLAGVTAQTLRLIKDWVLGLSGKIPPPPARIILAVKRLDDLIYPLIEACRKRTLKPRPLMQILLDAEDKGEIDNRQIRDELMTFFFAGFDTVAEMLSWTWYLLARNPDAEKQLVEETTRVLNNRPPELADLDSMPYNKAVLQESLRLNPPAWAFYRVAKENDQIGGYDVPKESRVAVCPYVLHRHGDYWSRTETFAPERFEEVDVTELHMQGAYIPFGYGRHICPGRRIALLEGQLILAMISQRYSLRLISKRPVRIIPGIIMKAKSLRMRLYRR